MLEEIIMQSNNSSFLRRVLAVDAISSGAMGLAMLSFGSFIAQLLNLPVDLIRDAGLVLLPFAAFVGYVASREHPPRASVWIIIALNVVWVVDSIVLLFTGWVEPNALGYSFVIAQAVVVGVFAELEYVGLKRAPTRAAA
jgi:hypothetical protein